MKNEDIVTSKYCTVYNQAKFFTALYFAVLCCAAMCCAVFGRVGWEQLGRL